MDPQIKQKETSVESAFLPKEVEGIWQTQEQQNPPKSVEIVAGQDLQFPPNKNKIFILEVFLDIIDTTKDQWAIIL